MPPRASKGVLLLPILVRLVAEMQPHASVNAPLSPHIVPTAPHARPAAPKQITKPRSRSTPLACLYYSSLPTSPPRVCPRGGVAVLESRQLQNERRKVCVCVCVCVYLCVCVCVVWYSSADPPVFRRCFFVSLFSIHYLSARVNRSKKTTNSIVAVAAAIGGTRSWVCCVASHLLLERSDFRLHCSHLLTGQGGPKNEYFVSRK